MWLRLTLLALLVANACLRFVALGEAPPGFFSDEARSGAHALCLAQTGRDAAGLRWPAYSPAGSDLSHATVGALYASPWTFPLALWLRFMGGSTYAVRSASAAFGVGSIALMVLLMWRLYDLTLGLAAGVVLACMPIHFQLSRLAWDNSSVPFYLLLGLFGLAMAARALHPAARTAWIAASAAGFALAAIVYPAQRLQLAVVLPFLLWQQQRGDRPLTKAALAGFAGTFALCCLPIAQGLWSGYLLDRATATSIFDTGWLRQWSGPELGPVFDASPSYRAWAGVSAFAHNLFAHLDPKFLWFSGDRELRHSSQLAGELGPLEAIALLCLGARKLRSVVVSDAPAREATSERLQLTCVVAILFGVIPSALTREAPHALRVYGVAPFVAIWVTLELRRAWDELPRKAGIASAIATALALLIFQVAFLHAYFTRYPSMARNRFEPRLNAEASRAAQTGRWEGFVHAGRSGSERIQRGYYAMSLGKIPCSVVREWSASASTKR